MSIVVRGAEPRDFDAVTELFELGDALHREGAPWMFRKPDTVARSRDEFDRLLRGPDSTLLVAATGDTVVGVATVLMRAAPDVPIFIPQRWGVLDNLVVAAAHRRQGLGTALVRAAEVWAAERGATFVDLNVYAFNDGARALYERLVYTAASTKLRKPMSG